MLIIPVIDLSQGVVVHAKQGLRKTYQPITSAISASADVENVISSFFELYPFKTIYIADLDAIQETGNQNEIILKLASHYKQCEFWVDSGIKSILNNSNHYSDDNIKRILGSENKLSKKTLSSLLINKPDLLLSLDFNKDGLIENSYLLENHSIWPEHIIVMSLAKVGTNTGFDKHRLKNILKLAKNNKVYAAGGIRNREDLEQLQSMKVSGALVATALHSGAITKEDLEQFYDK